MDYRICKMRSIAAIAIVALHISYMSFLLHRDNLGVVEMAYTNMITNLTMWAVPIFIMVSGALLLSPKRELNIKKIYGTYLLRIVIALVVFVIIFDIFDFIFDVEEFSTAWILNNIKELISGTGWSHLWYIYMLIGLYLMLPAYTKVAKHCIDSELKVLTLVALFFISIMPMLAVYKIKLGFYIQTATIYPIYLFLGHMIFENRIRITNVMAIAILVITSLLIGITTYMRWVHNDPALEAIWQYSSIVVVLQSVALFRLSLNMKPKKTSLWKHIDATTFGIYLIHVLFARLILRYLQFNPYSDFVVLNFIVLIVGIFLLSYLTIIMLKQLPLFKRFL